MYTRKIRATGETLTVARAAELNLDATDGKWVVVCDDHKNILNTATEKLAYYTHGADFCDGCRGLAVTKEFTNEKDAKAFAKSHGGPVNIHIERIARGRWMVDVSAKAA